MSTNSHPEPSHPVSFQQLMATLLEESKKQLIAAKDADQFSKLLVGLAKAETLFDKVAKGTVALEKLMSETATQPQHLATDLSQLSDDQLAQRIQHVFLQPESLESES